MNHTKINLRADVEIHVSLSESLANLNVYLRFSF